MYHMILFYLVGANDVYIKHFYAKDDNDLLDIYIDYSKRENYSILYHDISEVTDA